MPPSTRAWGRPVARQRPRFDKGSAFARQRFRAFHRPVANELRGTFEELRFYVHLDGLHASRAGAVVGVRRGIHLHASGVDHAHTGLRGGVEATSLFGEKRQRVQRDERQAQGVAHALGRRHSNAQTGERARTTRHRHGIEVALVPSVFPQHLVDERQQPLGVHVALVGAFLFPGHGHPVLGEGYRALRRRGFEDQDFGHHLGSTASPSFNERLTTS